MLMVAERPTVDAAGEGLYATMHRDSAAEVMRDLRENKAEAVVLSTARCDHHGGWIRRLVREFPQVPAVALLSRIEAQTPQTVLALGQQGVRALVDVREPAGWRDLRNMLLLDQARDIDRIALGLLLSDLFGAPDDCRRFFELLFRCSRGGATVRALADDFQVVPSTFMSRFFRARLPAPRRYLAMVRLMRAARLFENPGLSVASVANTLDYSSPQSFGRHIQSTLRMSAVEFRHRYDGEGMLQRFRHELILPYLPSLRRFSPLSSAPAWPSPARGHVRRAITPHGQTSVSEASMMHRGCAPAAPRPIGSGRDQR
jgi:AraC-like DNA-binding protein